MSLSSRSLALALIALNLAACSGSSNSPPPPAPAPLAQADSAESDNGASVLIDVLANDQGGGSALSITTVGTPANGSARISGARVDYTPRAGFFGTDRFSYRVSNAAGQTAEAQVSVSSAMTLRVEGRVVLLRDEPIRLRVLAGALPIEQSLSAGSPGFSIRLRSETPDRPVLLEAEGAESSGLPLKQRFASLLPSLRRLREQANCVASECAIADSGMPRLRLGILPTAEFGLLRELASADALLQEGVAARLAGYVPADSLLRHAALLERAILGLQRPELDYQAADSLALALSREELAKVATPLGGLGSGGVANEYALAFAGRRIALESPWSADAGGADQLRAGGSLTWLEAPSSNRRFAISQWRAGRLRGHADSSLQSDSSLGERQAFRATDIAVDSALEDAAVILRPQQAGTAIARRLSCYDDLCTERLATTLALHVFLGDYALLIERGPLDGASGEASLREAPVTLLQPVPLAEAELPGRVYTALSTAADPADPRRSRYFNEVLQLSSSGLFEFNDRSRAPPSARGRSGQWRLSADGRTLELDDFHGARERLWLAARGAGRGIGVLQSEDADGTQRIAAVEWLALGDESAPSLGEAPRRCDPIADGWQPAERAPATAPRTPSYLLAAEGSAQRFFGEPRDTPAAFDAFRWEPRMGRIDFVSTATEPALPGFQWWGLQEDGADLLVHVTHTHPDPLSASRYIERDQQFGASLRLRCRAP